MPQNGEDCESAHTLVRNDLGYARLNADYFGLKNIKPDKLPPACLGSVFEVPQSSLQIDQACVSRGGAVRANSSPDIRDSCASRKSSDVYGFRPEYHTCVGFLILVTLAPWTHAWPRRHHYKCVRFAGSAQRHGELCPWRKRQPYLRKKKETPPQQAWRAATAAAAAAARQSEATAGTKVAAAAAAKSRTAAKFTHSAREEGKAMFGYSLGY